MEEKKKEKKRRRNVNFCFLKQVKGTFLLFSVRITRRRKGKKGREKRGRGESKAREDHPQITFQPFFSRILRLSAARGRRKEKKKKKEGKRKRTNLPLGPEGALSTTLIDEKHKGRKENGKRKEKQANEREATAR